MNAMPSWLSDAMIQRLGWTLVHTLWQGVVVAAVLSVILRLLRAAPSNIRYAASCAAMSMMVLAAVFTLTRIHVAATPAAQANMPLRAVAPFPPSRPAPLTMLASSGFAAPAPPVQTPTVPPPATIRILGGIVTTWGVGVVLMSLWHAGGWLWLRRMRRGARLTRWSCVMDRLSERLNLRRRAVALIETVRIDVPAVVGVLRPVILVPAGVFTGLSPQQVEAILAHELAHVRRHDYLVNLIQSAVETLMFYHPATWWISAQIRQERENCCDDIAASICGDRGTYAAALAALEERRGVRADVALAASGGNLLARVRRVLNLPPVAHRSRARSLAAAALAIACAALPLVVVAQQNPSAKPQPSAPTSKPSDLAAAAAAAADVPASPILPEDLKEVVEDYRTGPGDLLSVSITDLVGPGVETVKQVRVSDTGVITTPLVGPIKVAGMTVPEMEKAVQKAYRDANLIANAQISVSVTEPKQRMFNVIGQVDKPGQYIIAKPGFRLLDALAQSGARTNDLTMLRVIRKENGGRQRVIEVPIEKLTSGDASVNLVIRPGDTIIADAAPKNFVKIVIGQDTLLFNGKPIDIGAVRQMFEAMGEAQRRGTVLEIAAASPDVTVERFFSASAQLSKIVQDLHLAYLSETGILPATSQPAAPAAREQPRSGAATLPSSLATDPVFQRYRSERNRLEMELNHLRLVYGPEHPSLRNMERELALITGQIDGYPRDHPAELHPTAAPALMSLLSERADMENIVLQLQFTYGPDHPVRRSAEATLAELSRRIASFHAPTTAEEIAMVDPTMREYLRNLDAMSLQLEQLTHSVGAHNPTYLAKVAEVEQQTNRIQTYADAYRKQFHGTTPTTTPPMQP